MTSMRTRTRLRAPLELVYNRIVTHIPFNPLRIWWLRRLGAKLGDHVYLFGSSEVIAPPGLEIAGNCHIGRYCQIDARGGIRLGTNVVIASHCLLITADHDPDDSGFSGRLGEIVIGDRVWIGSRATVLKNVTIGEGAVVAAGATVTSDIRAWSIVAGIPARVIGERSPIQDYEIDYGPTWY
jgi:putative colanic acid biosynthesis acetyltransferase WcaF